MNVAALKTLEKLVFCTAVLWGAVAAPGAMAGQSWNLADPSSSLPNDGVTTANGCLRSAGGGMGNNVNCNAGANTPITAQFTGWVTGDTTAGSTFTTGYLSNQGYNGIGLQDLTESTGSPYHTVDSINNSELVAIKFSGAVSLRSVTIGWSSGDTDFSVLAWTGASPPDLSATGTTSINGRTVSGANGLIAAGWKLVGQYGDQGGTAPDTSGATGDDSDRTIAINRGLTSIGDSTSGVITSSYWLVGAFNSGYSAANASGLLGRDNVADAWKLLSVSTNVPEPGSLALVGLALLGAVSARRPKATVA